MTDRNSFNQRDLELKEKTIYPSYYYYEIKGVLTKLQTVMTVVS